MGFFYFLKGKNNYETNQTRSSNRKLTEETFDVRGVYHYKGATKKLAIPNPKYSLPNEELLVGTKKQRRIFKYNYVSKPVELIHEPTNKHDKNAIIVSIAGNKVGYIPAESNEHVLSVLSRSEVKSISAFITGGPYKVLYVNGDEAEGEFGITITIKIKYIL